MPDFGAIAFWGVADEDDLEQWIVGLEIDCMMELGHERAEFLEEDDANLLEVDVGFAGHLVVFVGGRKVLNIAIEADWFWSGRRLPFGSAEEYGNVTTIDVGKARRDGSGFERVVDCGKKDSVAGYMDDDTAAGEVGDDFVLLRASCMGKREENSEENEERTHEECLDSEQVGWKLQTNIFPR